MRILTDLRLFGFPVMFDTKLSQKVIDLQNRDGQRIRITVTEEGTTVGAVDPVDGRVTG